MNKVNVGSVRNLIDCNYSKYLYTSNTYFLFEIINIYWHIFVQKEIKSTMSMSCEGIRCIRICKLVSMHGGCIQSLK